MPEGPEVRRQAVSLAPLSGRTIESAVVVGGRYTRVDPEVLGLHKLAGATIIAVSCLGKLLTFYMIREGEQFAALSTLGMSGFWALNTSSGPWDKHARIRLNFTDGSWAVFFDTRNFGTFKIVTLKEAHRKQAELGADILSHPSDLDKSLRLFSERMARFSKKQTVAETLLDQRIAAGSGNYIRADALWHAGISPLRATLELSASEVNRVWSSLQLVGRAALEDRSLFREGPYEHAVYGQQQSPGGNPVTSYRDKNGRTMWYCQEEQE